MLEIGAGHGRLTAELARAGGRVVAVEIDPACARKLAGRWPNVTVVEGDAAAFGLPAEPFRVVANLPFHRTTDLLHLLLDDPATPLLRADLVVEWPVAAKRGLPWPSTLNGVAWGAFYETAVGRRLPRTAFEPRPDADAGVLIIRRRLEPLVPPELAAAFRHFVAAGFRHGVRRVASRRALTAAGGDQALARDLDAHQWAQLFTEGLPATGPGRIRRL